MPEHGGCCGGDLTIINARLYPSPAAAPLDNATLIVHDGRSQASASGRGAQRHDTSEELRLARALNWRQILASLTTAPAKRFAHGAGTLATGAPADIVILEGDPASDVSALARVRYTIRAGRVIYQRE